VAAARAAAAGAGAAAPPVPDGERTDLSAVVLADANMVGDISGRGEFFSFIKDMSNRGLNAAHARMLFSAAPFGGRKEGTERDIRQLTNPQMAQILLSYGMPVARIVRLRRWERAGEIRNIETALMLAQNAAGNKDAVTELKYASGEVRASSRERRTSAPTPSQCRPARRRGGAWRESRPRPRGRRTSWAPACSRAWRTRTLRRPTR
jgi:hypothetical protein